MTDQTGAASRRGVPGEQTPSAVLAFLGVALTFLLGVTAIIAFSHGRSSLLFLVLAASSMSFTLGRLLPSRRR